ncbi:unnamed protein product [Schistosoma rodhaini]|uniref:C2 domain-containing protein n=1 Tax=Schistosoma rodhaini TaxID=6188 RepID=A0AA85EQ68_9TREM|nr:unnamed protein product [Schistosoma rodhaini]CAH8682065.1 unnamed protein product [Schistosoma rodhaini]
MHFLIISFKKSQSYHINLVIIQSTKTPILRFIQKCSRAQKNMITESNKIKDVLLLQMTSKYEDPNLWIDNYVANPSVSETEVNHLRSVMQRDQALKKADSERIYYLIGSFPSKLQPEVLLSNMNQLRNKILAVPGSGFVSTYTTVIQPSDINPIEDEDSMSYLEHIHKRQSCATLQLHKFTSKFSKLCPTCLHQFNSLTESYRCIKCNRNVCQNCAYKTSLSNSNILCKECWDIAKCICKTGDWFNYYTKTKETSPLKVDLRFKPLQSNLRKAKSEVFSKLNNSSKNIVSSSFKLNDKNERSSLNEKLMEETHSVKRRQISRSKSPQTLKTQNSWEYIKSGSHSTIGKNLSGFLEQSILSRSQSYDYLSGTSASLKDNEEFKEKSKRKRHLLRLKRLVKKNKSFKSNQYKASNEMDEVTHGEIDVSMEYDTQDQQLGVSLWAANKLAHEKYKIGLPHATISLLPDNIKYNLKVSGDNKWDGTDAVFDLSVCFTVHRSDLNKKIIVIKLWSRKGIKSQFTIGQAVIPIKECNLLLKACRQYFQLISENNSIITNSNINSAYYGQIKLALRFAISDYQKKVLCVADEAIDLIGVLDVWIKEGKNLHSHKAGTDINSYVTVELTDPEHKTECRSTDQILRSDQPLWNSLLQFSNKYLSELIESTMKIFIWNRSSNFSDPELLGIVQISNKEESELIDTANDNSVNANVYQGITVMRSTSLWESVTSKPGEWIEGLLNITAPNIK